MKPIKLKSALRRWMFDVGCSMFPLFLIALLTFSARAQDYATQYIPVNIPTNLVSATAGSSNSVLGLSFKIPQNQDVVFQITFSDATGSAGSSNTTFGFDFTTDGTQYTTTHPVTVTIPDNGTNTVSGVGFIARTNISGFALGRFSYMSTTQTNAVTVSSIFLSAPKNTWR